jgi:hypothetical protein
MRVDVTTYYLEMTEAPAFRPKRLARHNEMSSFDDISSYDLLATDRDILCRQHGIRAYFQGDLCWRRR